MLYSSSARTVLVLTLLLLAASAGAAEMRFSTWMLPAEVSVTVGKHQVLMPLDKNGVSRHGLNCFPDEPICILQQRPLAYLMVGNKDGKNATFLMKGNSIKDAAPVATVLAPGPRGTVDEQYAGVTSVYRDLKNKRLVGFYHAEKPIPLGTIEHSGYPATLATCCVAEAPLDGSAFTKLGEFITADKPVIIPGP